MSAQRACMKVRGGLELRARTRALWLWTRTQSLSYCVRVGDQSSKKQSEFNVRFTWLLSSERENIFELALIFVRWKIGT